MYKIKDLGELRNIMNDRDFINETIVLTTHSILLEIFAHSWMTIGSALCYSIYYTESKFCMFGI